MKPKKPTAKLSTARRFVLERADDRCAHGVCGDIQGRADVIRALKKTTKGGGV